MKRKKWKALAVVAGILLLMTACDDKTEKKKEQTTERIETINKYVEGAVTPSTCFGKEERTIWYYIKDKTENDAIQSVDADAIIDTIYVFENGNVITYDLDYEEFALDNKLGDLEQMSDDAIIEWLDENRQSEAQRYEDFKESELAFSKDVVSVDSFMISLFNDDEEKTSYCAMEEDIYWKYIFYLKKFDAKLFDEGRYGLNVVTDDTLKNTIKEELSFGYVNAMTIPRYEGMSLEYDENGKVVLVYDEELREASGDSWCGGNDPYAREYSRKAKYIESKAAVGKEYTFIDSKSVEQIGCSYYGGFEVENSYNYGATLEKGWFVTRTDENTQFGLDAVGTEGVDTNGLSTIGKE